MQHGAIGLLIPVLIIFQHSQGLSFLEISLIQSIGFITLLLSEIPSSYAADIWNKKKVMILGLLSLGISFFILSFADNFFTFLISEIFFALGLSSLSGTEESFLLSTFHSKKTELLLREFQIADEVGTIGGMILSYMFLSLLHINIQHTFIVGFLLVLFSITIVFFLPNDKGTSERQWVRKNSTGMKAKILLPLAVIFILAGGLMQERGESVFQIGLEQSGIAIGFFGVVYAVAKIGSLLGSYFSTFFLFLLGKDKILIWGALMQATIFFFLLFLHPIFSALALFLFFFVENIYRVAYKSIIADTVPKKWLTSSFSIVSLGGALLLLFTKIPIGILLDETIEYAIYFILGIKIAAAILFLWSLFRIKKILPRK
ncbi:MFS transporter [Candidatus Peregrinibacteria bacterium]|nr:MAG: MFS transporter [Candidatus Peregrinibacteria bacterium]